MTFGIPISDTSIPSTGVSETHVSNLHLGRQQLRYGADEFSTRLDVKNSNMTNMFEKEHDV